MPKKKKDTFPCFPNVLAISLSLSPEGAIQAGKDGVSDATDAEDATVAAVASAGVDQASLVVGGWWRLRNPYEKLDEPSTNHTNP